MTERPITRRAFARAAGGVGGIVLAFALAPRPTAAQPRPARPGSLAATPRLDAWIRIESHGTATVFTGKVELGQGLLTALAQIAAEELDLPMEQVRMISGDTERTPDEGFTAGSRSIETSGAALRQAAAEVRAILVDLAAPRLGVAADALAVRNGVVTAPDGRSVGYGELAAAARIDREATGRARPKPASAYAIVGTAVPRRDLPAKTRGRAAFVHDLRPDGMLHGRVVRPPRYGSILETVDSEALKDVPGVVALVRDGSFLAVVTEREEQAVRAWEALRRGTVWSGGATLPEPDRLYEHLRRLPAAEMAIERRDGPPRATAGAGARTLTATYRKPYVSHAPLGPPVALALFRDGALTVWTHAQGVFPLRRSLAAALSIQPSDIRCIHAEGAGCFGHDGADDAALDAALLARALPGQPVRVQWMRDDAFAWAPYGPAMMVDLEGTVSAEGRIVDWSHAVWSNTHAMRPGESGGVNLLAAWQLGETPQPVPPRTVPHPAGGGARNAVPLYDLPRRQIVERRLLDMPLRVSALRSLGAYANLFAIESFMDELALAAGADPLAFRLAHLRDERARTVLETAARKAGWTAKRKGDGRHGRGLGVARYRNSAAWVAVVADVEVDRRSGTVRLVHAVAAVDAGQIVNPDGVTAQIEGGLLQSASWTLKEAVRFDTAGITSRSWADYPILTMAEVPTVEVVLIDRTGEPSLGVGEAALGPAAAAIANALAHATGVRVRELPLTPARVQAALDAAPVPAPRRGEKRR